VSKEKILLEDAKELIAYSANTLKSSLKNLSKKYGNIEKTFFEEAYVPTKKRDQLLESLKQDMESGKFGLLYFIAPFGFGKTFFVEHMKEVIGKVKFGKKYKIHIIPVDMYRQTFNGLIVSIVENISEKVLAQDVTEIANEYFSTNLSSLEGFPIELRDLANEKKITKEDLEKEILGRLGTNDKMDFITELLRQSFDQKETVCIFIVDELERLAQEDKESISPYKFFFSKLVRQSLEIPYWKLILSAPLEITEYESRHPLLGVLSQDAADRLRDFDKDEYKLLFEAKEATQFMQGMLSKTFEIISSRSNNTEGKKWLDLLKTCGTFPVDPELLEILARIGLRQIGQQGLIQDFRSYIALVRYAIEIWVKHYDEFLETDSPPINFSFFSEYSKEIQEQLNMSVEAKDLGGINRAVFKYNVDEFLKKHLENKSIVEFLLSLIEQMKTGKQRERAFDLSSESKKHQFKQDALLAELKKIPSYLGNAFNLNISNNSLTIELDELGKLILEEIPSLGPTTGPDPFYKCVQEVRDMSLFDILQKHFVNEGASVDEKEGTITIEDCAFDGRVILFSKDATSNLVEKVKKNINEYSGPAFALKVDESDPKWPNSKEFFILPKWMKDDFETILQFEKYGKWREKRTEPFANRLNEFKSQYNISATIPELEQLVLYKVPLWHRVHGKKDEPLPTPPFLDIGGLVLIEDFLKTYTDTEGAIDQFIRSVLGLFLPKTQTIASLVKFFVANFGKSFSEYDESLIRKNKHILGNYDEIFKDYTFKAGKFSTSWSRTPSSLDEIRKELEKNDYIKDNIVKENFENFSPISELPEKTQEIVRNTIQRLDKEDLTLPKLCEIIFGRKPKEEDHKVAWEDPERLDACLLVCVLCMANLEMTLEIKNKKIFLNKDVLDAKKSKLASEIALILAEELSWALFNNKEIDLSHLRKLNKQLENAKKLKDFDEVATSIASYSRKTLPEEEFTKKIQECKDLITSILTERMNLAESDREKVQQFYVEFRNWLSQMEVAKKDYSLILLWHIRERLSSVLNHLTYCGKAKIFNKKLENSGALLGAYKEFDEREERSSAIITTIEEIAKEYGGAWFTESDFPQKFENKMKKTVEQLMNEKTDCKEAIDALLFIPRLLVKPNQIASEIKVVEKRDQELEGKLEQFKSELKNIIDTKEKIVSTYEDVKKWSVEIAKLKVALSQFRTIVEECNLEAEDLKKLKKDVDAKIEEIEKNLDEIVDLNDEEKKLYRIVTDNDRSFIKILKSKGITDYTKQREQVVELLEKVIELRKKTGIDVWL
jgi:hypothetical protein